MSTSELMRPTQDPAEEPTPHRIKSMPLHVDLPPMDLDSSTELVHLVVEMRSRHEARRARLLEQDLLWSDMARALTKALAAVSTVTETRNLKRMHKH